MNTLPETITIAFEDHGTVARTIDRDITDAAEVREGLARVGVDMEDVGLALEKQGVASFRESFLHVLETLTTKAHKLARG